MSPTMVGILGAMAAAIVAISLALVILAGYMRFGRRRVPLAVATKIWEMPAGIGTMAGALLSFVVVTGGYLINGELSRQKELAEREARKLDLAGAFQSEILDYKRQAEARCLTFGKILGRFAVVGGDEYSAPVVWQAKLGEVGILGAETSSRLRFFYTALEGSRSIAGNPEKTTETKFSSAATLSEAASLVLPMLEAITRQPAEQNFKQPGPCANAPKQKFPPRHPLDPPE